MSRENPLHVGSCHGSSNFTAGGGGGGGGGGW